MQVLLHKADTRGHANYGWLDTHHTFSFGNYYHPERVHFGALRVLNDDVVAPGRGFGRHPHDNMEIISIPLEGDLEHRDSMGNRSVIRTGDIQVMSAGTGISHSESNKNNNRPVKFLQIWIIPNQKDVNPRYDQITMDPGNLKNQLHQIVSPYPATQGVWIHQDAWFYRGDLDSGQSVTHRLHSPGNGVYLFVLEASLTIFDYELSDRDGVGITGIDSVRLSANSPAQVLVMEVPMLN